MTPLRSWIFQQPESRSWANRKTTRCRTSSSAQSGRFWCGPIAVIAINGVKAFVDTKIKLSTKIHCKAFAAGCVHRLTLEWCRWSGSQREATCSRSHPVTFAAQSVQRDHFPVAVCGEQVLCEFVSVVREVSMMYDAEREGTARERAFPSDLHRKPRAVAVSKSQETLNGRQLGQVHKIVGAWGQTT